MGERVIVPPKAVRRLDLQRLLERHGPPLALLALVLFNAAVTPNFLSWQTLNVNLTQVCTTVIVGVGMTLVIATGGIDLSVGSLMAIAGALAPLIFLGNVIPGLPPGVAIALAFVLPVLVTSLLGMFNGWLITRFQIQPIIATLVLFIAGRGIAQVLTNGNLQVFHTPEFQFIGLGRIGGIPFQALLMLAMVALAAWMLRRSVFGRRILVIGGNERAAALAGVPVALVVRAVYAISGALAGIAGLIVIAINSSSDANLVGLGTELDAIAAVAVGGTPLTGGRASIAGTLWGALIIQLVRYTLLANGVPDSAALVAKAAIIVLAVWLARQRGAAQVSPQARPTMMGPVGRYGVFAALLLLILFGWLRYDNFLGEYNVLSFLRYNAMFALVALGMCFVIMSGGIDLSVGSTAAFGSVTAALLSPYGTVAGIAGGLAAGLMIGVLNAFCIIKLRILPFIATLATMLAASGCALLLAGNQSVSVSYDTGFTWLGQGDVFRFPVPAWIALLAYIGGSIVLTFTAFGRTVLAVGGNEDASRLMGLSTDRAKIITYLASGALAGLAGAILAAQFGAGQPIEGVGWELFAIAATVVGGTLLTGGEGSVGSTLAGVLLLGLIFNILNFENGLGWISLSAYWQSVVRGLFLLLVVIVQARLVRRPLQTR
ncbi:Ribose/xylose/arabinose/galactoside ABC-type transport system, permease component [Bradyrhizobium sp. Gha]|nr:Ribose/xylose/arabinose/galactoside ABC-type transport system, permease component [Bradyrhizobium sp. Gha]